MVTDLTTGSVDINSLAEAGLYSEDVLYRTLQLAQVGGIAPGATFCGSTLWRIDPSWMA